MDTKSSLPPGITGDFTYYTDGGHETEWISFTKTKLFTNAFVIHDGKLLLGYKKRGFGIHKYNGFGGKVENQETSLQAADRELKEEAGIHAHLEHAGSLLFFNKGAEFAFHIDIYRADGFTGTVTESEEMRPAWFALPDASGLQDKDTPSIPFDDMWDTDRHWLPLLISKRKFIGRADFEPVDDNFRLLKWWFGVAAEDLS